jgi:catechol 2,3-dioxygenase-like lactoylglutathione lyase family enzyme
MPAEGGGGPMPEGLVSHLIHTCVVCSDFDRSLDFYTRVLGARVGGRVSEGDAAELAAAMGAPARRRWRGAMLYWGDPARTSLVDLIAYDGGDGGETTAAPARAATDPGLARLCLRVTDVEAAAAHLRANGVELVSDPFELEIEGRVHRILFFRDPDGTLLELSERVGPSHRERRQQSPD